MTDDENLVCGVHAVSSVLSQDPERVERVWFDENRHDARLQRVVDMAKKAGIRFSFVPSTKLDDLAGGLRHQGVLARRQPVLVRDERSLGSFISKLKETPFVLVLDEVQDPHNLGACLRSAEAAGVHAVILPRSQSAPLTATVARVSCGAVERVPVFQVANLSRALQLVRDAGLWIVGAVPEAENLIFDTDFRAPLALVLGGEERGLRRLTREACDVFIRIPLAGAMESLNVSVAAGICLYEVVRQRRLPGASGSS